MKSKILAFALLASSLISFGQVEKNSKDRSRFGVRGGVNYSNIIYGGDADFKPKVGFNIGGTYNVVSSTKLTLPWELLYSKIGSTKGDVDFDISMIYVNLMTNYYINKNIYVEWGIPFSFFLSANTYDNKTNVKKDFMEETFAERGLDVGLAVGVGYEFTNRVLVNLRYSYGFLPVFIYDDNSSHLSNLSLNVGYSF